MVRKKIRRVVGETFKGLLASVTLAALVVHASIAHGTALQLNPDLQIEGFGVTFSIDGVGLRGNQIFRFGGPRPPGGENPPTKGNGSSGSPTDAVDSGPSTRPPGSAENVGGNSGIVTLPIGGPILKAYLYWGGRGQLPGDSTIKLNDQIVDGTLIGTEATTVDIAYAYRADVTIQIQALFIPPGILNVEIQDATPAVNLVDGATLLVIWRNLSDPNGYTVQVYEGSDYAYAPRPGAMGVTSPVNFNYDPDDDPRSGQIAVVVGDATTIRPDRITISHNPVLNNTLDASDGPQWDTDVHVISIPANIGTTTVQVISPPEFGFDSDSLQWVMALLRAPCTGEIGDFVWDDANGNGIQDMGEAGIPGIRLQLYVDLGGGIKQFIRETTTGFNGAYLFDGLCSGSYEVRVVQSDIPPGYVETIAGAGGNPLLDSNCINGVMTVTLPTDSTEDHSIDCGLFPGNVTGSCCLDGNCIDDLAESECDFLGGVFQGQGSVCDEVNCAPNVGACCLPNGNCLEAMTAAQCDAQAGTFQGNGSLCRNVTCPQPTGACCLPNGSCQVLEQGPCIALGGTYQGHFSKCNEVVCPQPGACCLPNGTCRQEVVIGGTACVADGGIYQGNGTTCATANCPGGACCFPDGSCVPNISQPACTGQGATWAGLSVSCTAANCPQPGACCLPDGSCRDEALIGAAQCLADGGVFQGNNTECGRVECPQPGACCLPDGTCRQETVVGGAQCNADGGTYQGNDTTCAQVVCIGGACCLNDGSCIGNISQPSCTSQGGMWMGLNISCAGANCPQPGACCLPDGTCRQESLIGGAQCVADGGTYQGNGTTCATVQCPGGACCFNYGGCLENLTQPDCIGAGGQWAGLQVSCSAANCPQPGACCLPNGTCRIDAVIGGVECDADGGAYQGDNSTCTGANCPGGACCLTDGSCVSDISQPACAGMGGSWTGVNVSCSLANCPQPGACCMPDGTCRIEAVIGGAQCLVDGGTYAGDNINCDLARCPAGVCCLPEGTCAANTNLAQCDALGGLWGGVNSQCTDTFCAQPGACCLPDGTCREETIIGGAQCIADGGIYQGNGTSCGMVQCPGGACCLNDGTCIENISLPACSVQGGAWAGLNVSCAAANCPQPGACCLPNGTCRQEVVIGGAQCAADGGVYQGDNTSCATANCPGGACCFNDGSCVPNLSQPDCISQSGVWSGLGVSCAAANCPQPGACCLPNGTCRQEEVIGGAQCAADGGVYQGDNTSCATANCPGGACCFIDGSCVPNLSQPACIAQSGVWAGLGVSCAAANCPQPGACCLPDGSCDEETEIGGAKCAAEGGVYQGDNTTCATVTCPRGACCFANGSCLENTIEGNCVASGGEWQQLGSTCSSAHCPQPGACCLPDGTCRQEMLIGGAACAADGGVYQGDSTTCATANCPGGACCIVTGACIENISLPACLAQNGVWAGLNVPCATANCPQPGACCIPTGLCVPMPVIGGLQCAGVGGVYQGDNTTCATVNCPQPGACCLPDGTCMQVPLIGGGHCSGVGGTYQGDNTTCALSNCPGGACCFTTGLCTENLSFPMCNSLGGFWAGLHVSCSSANCPQPGACCLPDGTCRLEALLGGGQCAVDGGVYQGDNSNCATAVCPQPGACCLPSAPCRIEALLGGAQCIADGGTYQGDDTDCGTANCPQVPGACCLQNGACLEIVESECEEMNGFFHGSGTVCGGPGVVCPTPTSPDVGKCSQKGSLVVWSNVEVRLSAGGQLVQDTYITLDNDYPEGTRVQLYFVNGDTWSWLDVMISLTKDEPTYWRASDGLAKGVPPFTSLPGILDPEGSGDTVYRGFIVGWAMNSMGQEIKFNHLSGGAVIVNYRDTYAWEYTACAYAALPDGPTGMALGSPGQLELDGVEYESPADILLLDFFAVDAPAWAPMGVTGSDMDLTLHPVSADLRQNTTGPVATQARFAVWNENEFKLSGMEHCVFCWHQMLASDYIAPNHFLLSNLQTDRGRARIDGQQTPLCDFDFDVFDGPLGTHPFDIVSQDAALLGVTSKLLYFNNNPAATGTNLVTLGKQSAIIHYDVHGGSAPESHGPNGVKGLGGEQFDEWVRRQRQHGP